jgi:hypothetical protein
MLRRKNQPITLWVDAVCINQNDTREVSEQITLMPRIYQRAISTLACLGEGSEHDLAIQALMQIRAKDSENLPEQINGSQRKNSLAINKRFSTTAKGHYSNTTATERPRQWPKGLPPIPTSWGKRPIPPPDDRIWETISEFCRHPWFRRAWVIQEVVFSSSIRIICGKWVVEWNDLFSAIETVDRAFSLSAEYDPIDTKWEYFLELAKYREWEARKTRFALINLLESFRYAESTRTRDRLFALTALASDWDNAAFSADYDSKLEDIVRRFAWAFVQQGKVMLLLYRAGMGPHSDRFPSWIPDWTITKSRSLFQSSVLGVKCAASWVYEPKVIYKPGSEELSISGCAVDTVKIISSTKNTPDQLSVYLKEVDTLVSSIKKNPVSDSLSDLKWKVPIAGALYPRMSGGEANIQRSFEALKKELGNSNLPNSSTSSEEIMGGKTYRQALHGNFRGWRVFVTQKEYVGICSDGLKAGDRICILDGGAVPFAVRRGTFNRHRLVGECYVHGLMEGEGKRLQNIRREFFILH